MDGNMLVEGLFYLRLYFIFYGFDCNLYIYLGYLILISILFHDQVLGF